MLGRTAEGGRPHVLVASFIRLVLAIQSFTIPNSLIVRTLNHAPLV